jgi:membrane fusion protein, multidrug efflux system
MKKIRMYRYGWFIVALALFVVLAGCQKREVAGKKEAVPEAIPVKVVTVTLEDIQEVIDYVANVKAQQEVMVYPKVSGKIIEKIKQEGDVVSKGDAIAFIDRDEVGLTYEKAPVESPLSGVVGSVLVDIGTHVSTQTPVALVVDMERMKVYLDMPEKYLPKIKLGMDAGVVVEAYPLEVFKGKVERISPMVDIGTRTALVEIVIDNADNRLRSGMYAKVKLVTQQYKASPVVLKEAVLGKEPKQYVYVVSDQKAYLKDVQTGIRQGPYLQIKEGLVAGDKVVIMGQQRLYDGAAVLAEENGKH